MAAAVSSHNKAQSFSIKEHRSLGSCSPCSSPHNTLYYPRLVLGLQYSNHLLILFWSSLPSTMFRKFDASNDVSTSTPVKSSVQRALKTQIMERHSGITEEHLEALLPKRNHLVQYKVGPHLMLYCRHIEHDDKSPTDEPVLFQHRDGPILPTLKLVHQYPTLEFTRVTVDKGAIPFLLGGANVMCPGLTNPGGKMPPDDDDNGKPGLSKGDGVVIYAEGKEYAIAIGVMTMSSADV